MRLPAPCRCAKPAFPISRQDTIRPATRTSFLIASNSAPGVRLYLSSNAAGVSVQRNSRGYGSCPSAWICSSFFWRCSNWSRGSNCKGKILSAAMEFEYKGAPHSGARNTVVRYSRGERDAWHEKPLGSLSSLGPEEVLTSRRGARRMLWFEGEFLLYSRI